MIKPLSKAHILLCEKSPRYHAWHHHKHHKKVHWAALSIYIVIIGALLYSSIPFYAKAAYTFQATWDTGTSLDADSGRGSLDALNDGIPAEHVTPGFGDAGGAVKITADQTLKYETNNNINKQRSTIDAKFQLPMDLTGTDNSLGKFGSNTNLAYDSTEGSNVVYVVDSGNNAIVRMHWNGEVFDNWYSIGSLGSSVFQFNNPHGIAFDSAEQVAYIADTNNNRVVRMHWNGSGWDNWFAYGIQGIVVSYSTYKGGDNGQFNTPQGIAFDSTDKVAYVVDAGNNRIVRMHWNGLGWDSWKTFGSYGGGARQFSDPRGIAFDTTNHIAYVADLTNNRIVRIRWNTSSAKWDSWSTYNAEIQSPYDVSFDVANQVAYIAEKNTGKIDRVHWNGSGWDDFSSYGEIGAGEGNFNQPKGIVFDESNQVAYVSDTNNQRIVRIHWNTVGWDGWYNYGTPVSSARNFSAPQSVAYDSANSIAYIVDSNNNRIIRTHWNASISSWDSWSSYGVTGNGEGQFNIPKGIAIDTTLGGGKTAVYVTDFYNSRIVRIVWNQSNESWEDWFDFGSGGTGTDCFSGPTGIAFDSINKIAYVTDTYNYRVIRIHWNNGSWNNWYDYGTYGSGTGYFYNPTGIAFDVTNQVAYVSDYDAGHIVRMHWNNGSWNQWSTYGTNGSGDDNLYTPAGIDFDSASQFAYIADTGNNRIVRIHWNGSTWDNRSLYGSFGGEEDQFNNPTGITYDPTSKLAFITDKGNNSLTQIHWNTGSGSWENFRPEFGDYYKNILVTDGGNPLILRINYFTRRLEFYLSKGNKDVFIQSEPLTLAKNTWYRVRISYDAEVGNVAYYIYNSTGTQIYSLSTNRSAWTEPESIGSFMYVGSEPNSAYINRTLGGMIDDLKIESLNPPPAPSWVTASPSGYTATNSFKFMWGASSGFGSEDLDSYEYNINGGDWTSVDKNTTETDQLTGIATKTSQNKGRNVFSVRSKGKFGNYSSAISTYFYWDQDAPNPPTNIVITPVTSSEEPLRENNFTISWQAPTAMTGDPSKIRYKYYVGDEGEVPTASRGIWVTDTSLPAGPYGVKQGINYFYVKAEGESGVMGAAAMATFYVETPNPGPPQGLISKDTSNKDLKQYEMALRWQPPDYKGIGIAGYEIYRSDDGEKFAKIAETPAANFYQADLESRLYYYKVRSYDSAKQYSVDSEIVSIIPRGTFTKPPVLKSHSMSILPKPYSAKIKWTTQDEELKNVHKAQSFIEYGLTPETVGKAAGGWEFGNKELVDDHEITLTGLKPDHTKYYFRLVWIDSDGNTASFSDFNEKSPTATIFTTDERPTTSQPTYSNQGLYTMTIDYITSIETTTQINYGLSATNMVAVYTDNSEIFTRKHTINLKNLSHSSTYYFVIKGNDSDGNALDIGAINEFSTLVMPEIDGNVTMDQDKDAPSTTYRFAWKTNVPTTSIVYYTSSDGKKLSKSQPELTYSHNISVPDLADMSTYSFIATGYDNNGIQVEKPFTAMVKTPLDSRPPKISNLTVDVKASGVGASQKAQLVVSWETDEPATSQVEYGQGIASTDYPYRSQQDSSPTYYHVVIISELEPAKLYHLQAVSADVSGNISKSTDTTAITGKMQKSVIDLIVNSLTRSLGFLSSISNLFGSK